MQCAFGVNLLASVAFGKGRDAWDFVDKAFWIPAIIVDVLLLCSVAWLDELNHRRLAAQQTVTAAGSRQHPFGRWIAISGFILMVVIDLLLLGFWGSTFKNVENAVAPQTPTPSATTTAIPTATASVATPTSTPRATSTAIATETANGVSTPTNMANTPTLSSSGSTTIVISTSMRVFDLKVPNNYNPFSVSPAPTPPGWMKPGFKPNTV